LLGANSSKKMKMREPWTAKEKHVIALMLSKAAIGVATHGRAIK